MFSKKHLGWGLWLGLCACSHTEEVSSQQLRKYLDELQLKVVRSEDRLEKLTAEVARLTESLLALESSPKVNNLPLRDERALIPKAVKSSAPIVIEEEENPTSALPAVSISMDEHGVIKMQEETATSPVALFTPGDRQAKGAFEKTLKLFQTKGPKIALPALQKFLQTYPQSPYAANARYWLGISYFELADYLQAVPILEELISRSPTSDLAPEALLKIALAHQHLGDQSQAQKTYQRLLSEYPESALAELARSKLTKQGI